MIKKSQLKLSLFTFIFFNLLLALFIIVYCSFFYFENKNFLRNELEIYLKKNIEKSDEYFINFYEKIINRDLLIVNRSPVLDEYLSSDSIDRLIVQPKLEQLLKSFTDKQDLYLSFLFLESNQEIAAFIRENKRKKNGFTQDIPDDLQLFNIINQSFNKFSVNTEQKVIYSDPFLYQGKLTFVASFVKEDPESGGFGGVIFAHCSLSPFIDYLSNLNYFGVPTAWLFHDESNIVLSPINSYELIGVKGFNDAKKQYQTMSFVSKTITPSYANNDFFTIAFSGSEELLAGETNKLKDHLLRFVISIFIVLNLFLFIFEKKLLSRIQNKQDKIITNIDQTFTMLDFKEIKYGTLTQYIGEIQAQSNSYEYLIRKILSNTNSYILQVDREMIITYVDEHIQSLLGYAKEDLEGENVAKIMTHTNFKIFRSKIFELGKKKDFSDEFNFFINNQENEDIPIVSVLIKLFDSHQHGRAYICILRNNTEYHSKIKKLMLKKDRSDQENQAKTHFISAIVNKVMTPINSIKGFSQYLLQTELDNVQRNCINKITSSSELILSLLRDAYDLTKIEGNNLSLDEIVFNFHYLIHNVLLFAKDLVRNEIVSLEYNIDSNIPIFMRGDPSRVRQILFNLLKTVITLSSTGVVRINIVSNKSNVNKKGEYHEILFKIKNDKIKLSKQQKVDFNLFLSQYNESVISFLYTELKLSLYITKKLINLMYGDITLDTLQEVGMSFKFSICLLNSEDTKAHDFNQTLQSNIPGKKILLIHNNNNIQFIINTYCKKSQIEILAKFSLIEEVLDWLEQSLIRPDGIIYCDSINNEKSKIKKLPEYVKNNVLLKNIQLIFISSNSFSGVSRQVEYIGYDAFLAEPFSEEDFLAVLKFTFMSKNNKQQIVTRHMLKELPFSKLNVLVIDNDPIGQELLDVLLTDMGCTVDLVKNSFDVLTKLRKSQYAICVIDISVAPEESFETMKIIRQQISQKLPIIAIANDVTEELLQRCQVIGVHDILGKPITLEALQRCIVENYMK